jgi:hypothetical protein
LRVSLNLWILSVISLVYEKKRNTVQIIKLKKIFLKSQLKKKLALNKISKYEEKSNNFTDCFFDRARAGTFALDWTA